MGGAVKAPAHLGTLADVQPATQKWAMKSRLTDSIAAQKADEKALREFRAAVWTRDKGLCRLCGVKVIKTLSLNPRRGEVHHLRGRHVAPEDRYNVKKALLLCARCHEQAQRHQVKVPKP